MKQGDGQKLSNTKTRDLRRLNRRVLLDLNVVLRVGNKGNPSPLKKKKKDTLSFIEKSGKAIKILELNTDKSSSLLPFLRPKNRRNYTKTVVYLCY